MQRTVRAFAATTLVLGASAAPALAAPTDSAVLDCGESAFVVDGFGRGQVLHVVGSTSNFIVTRAEVGGTVVFDSPSRADRTLVTCTTVSPGSNKAFTFTGFFT